MNETREIIIETPRWSITKYKDDGSVDYKSPLPCPFNYGGILGTKSGDGDRIDAIVLGKRLDGGTQITASCIGVVLFRDKGELDLKVIFSDKPATKMQRFTIWAFFTFFVVAKRLLNKVRGETGKTELVEVNWDLFYLAD